MGKVSGRSLASLFFGKSLAARVAVFCGFPGESWLTVYHGGRRAPAAPLERNPWDSNADCGENSHKKGAARGRPDLVSVKRSA